jgi:hypothetical protein
MGIFRPLMGRRAKRKVQPDKVCMTAGCGTKIVSWKWLCDSCFGRLPYARKKEICEARGERAPHRVFGLSRDAAEWLAAQRAKLVGEG